mmetsp:Transcript_22673/g.66670  ORF Transcript_22673/g.66670 Transcript_22673/m.66670 type:complete len:433 (+) Transcript_22673:48-1346(+)
MASVVPIPAVAPEGSFDPDDPLVALPYIGKTFRTVLDLTKGSVRTNLSQLLVQQLTTNVRLLPTDPTDKAFNALVKFVMKYDKLEKHAREIVKKGKVVKHNLSKQAAEALKKKLEALGGKAEIGGGIAIDRKGPINTGYVLKVKGSDVKGSDVGNDFIEELSFQMTDVKGNSAINRDDVLDSEKWVTSTAGEGSPTPPSFVLEATLGVSITLHKDVKLVLDSPNFLFPDLTADWNEKPIKISDMRAQFEIDFTKFDTSDPKNSEFTIKFDILEEYNPKVEWDVSLSAFFVNLPVPDIITPALAQNLVMNLLPKVTPVSVTYSEGHFEWTVKPTLKPKTFFKNWGRSVLCCHPELTLHSLCIGLPQICADCCIGCSLDFWRQCFEGEAPCCGACRAGLCCCDGGILACCCKPSKGDEKESGTVTVTSKASDPV